MQPCVLHSIIVLVAELDCLFSTQIVNVLASNSEPKSFSWGALNYVFGRYVWHEAPKWGSKELDFLWK